VPEYHIIYKKLKAKFYDNNDDGQS